MIFISFNQHSSYISLPAVTTYANEPQDLRAGVTRPKFTKFVAVVIFSSSMLKQQSALRSVHPLSNERGDIEKSNISKT